MSKRKLDRVLFEFDDGTAEEITGPLADEWYQTLRGRDALLAVHGQEFPEHLSNAWKPAKKAEGDAVRKIKSPDRCANGCDAPVHPPSKVVCKACWDRIAATLKGLAERLDEKAKETP